jgi:hypothetical protein
MLTEEDATFLKRFLAASGSLKELARIYGVSYPTVRLRLDRLIQKVRMAEEMSAVDPFERQLRALVAEGRLESGISRHLLRMHQDALREHGEDAGKISPFQQSAEDKNRDIS